MGPPVSGTRPGARSQLVWTGALLAVAVAAALASDLHGRGARTSFTPPAEFHGERWAVVQDAAAAVDVWGSSGLHGRRLLVATGRWGKPVTTDGASEPRGAPPEDPEARAADHAARVSGALFDATMQGVARELLVVMPDAAFDARVDAIRAARGTTLGDGWASQPYDGIPRGFYRPATLPGSDEAVLLLVEPSFFAAGAPADLPAWLGERGLRVDLALIAAEDPEATAAQREAALALAGRAGAVQLEVGP